MSAAILGLGERAAAELGRGQLSQVFIEGDDGYVLLIAAGDRAVLTCLADVEAKLGLVLYDMRDAADSDRRDPRLGPDGPVPTRPRTERRTDGTARQPQGLQPARRLPAGHVQPEDRRAAHQARRRRRGQRLVPRRRRLLRAVATGTPSCSASGSSARSSITPQALDARARRARRGGRRTAADSARSSSTRATSPTRSSRRSSQEQIQDTIFDLMRWDEGDFDFEATPEVVGRGHRARPSPSRTS